MKFALVKRAGLLVGLVVLGGCQLNPSPGDRSVSPAASPPSSPSPIASGAPTPTRKVETQLESLLSNALEVSPLEVICPEIETVKVGDRIECRGTAAAQTFPIEVEFTSKAGAFTWKTKNLLILSKLEKFIQVTVKERSEVNVTADCGDKIRIAKLGDTFECKVSDAQGRSRSAKVVVKDTQGQVDVTL